MMFLKPDRKGHQNKSIMCFPCSDSIKLEILKNQNCPFLQKLHKSHFDSDLVLLQEWFSD